MKIVEIVNKILWLFVCLMTLPLGFCWASAEPSDVVAGEYIVAFRELMPFAEQKRFVRSVLSGAVFSEKKPFWSTRYAVIRSAASLTVMAGNEKVRYVQPNYIYRAQQVDAEGESWVPDDPMYRDQWHLHAIKLESAWSAATGSGVTVAVLDTGVHPAGRDGFGDRLLEGYNAFLGLENRWQDNNYHGTHVAGTIGQETGNSIGVAGIAYEAHVLPVKVLNARLLGTSESVAAGIRWAADNGADIINMSLAHDGREEDRVLYEAVKYAYGRGVVLISSAGNSNRDKINLSLSYPAAYAEVISVGAVDRFLEHGGYSNGGEDLDLVAPGGMKNANGLGVLQETFRSRPGFSRIAF
ncbi:MAG: S8 family serine peptidase, partial [bacterium]|nr:S8 family serine peptidase [bacterium]